MKVTAWNNGSHSHTGAGYGLKVNPKDRDKYFKKDWYTIDLYLEGIDEPIKINIGKPSFWRNCSELIHKEIGTWLIDNGKAPWEKGQPPKFTMQLTQKAISLRCF